jgi:hypothetical protein
MKKIMHLKSMTDAAKQIKEEALAKKESEQNKQSADEGKS